MTTTSPFYGGGGGRWELDHTLYSFCCCCGWMCTDGCQRVMAVSRPDEPEHVLRVLAEMLQTDVPISKWRVGTHVCFERSVSRSLSE